MHNTLHYGDFGGFDRSNYSCTQGPTCAVEEMYTQNDRSSSALNTNNYLHIHSMMTHNVDNTGQRKNNNIKAVQL